MDWAEKRSGSSGLPVLVDEEIVLVAALRANQLRNRAAQVTFE
jgi:hypothetical protein